MQPRQPKPAPPAANVPDVGSGADLQVQQCLDALSREIGKLQAAVATLQAKQPDPGTRTIIFESERKDQDANGKVTNYGRNVTLRGDIVLSISPEFPISTIDAGGGSGSTTNVTNVTQVSLAGVNRFVTSCSVAS